jgi:threonine dehydrogenase-like Zn-dependent dehydrogenase
VDVAFEVAGVNDAVEQAIAVTMPGGRVVLVGIPEGDWTSFRVSVARRKGPATQGNGVPQGRDFAGALDPRPRTHDHGASHQDARMWS